MKQVTDIHVTHFGHADRTEQFEQFCNETIKIIVKPQVTVVSGRENISDRSDHFFAIHPFGEQCRRSGAQSQSKIFISTIRRGLESVQ
jgi:hypothetical protein